MTIALHSNKGPISFQTHLGGLRQNRAYLVDFISIEAAHKQYSCRTQRTYQLRRKRDDGLWANVGNRKIHRTGPYGIHRAHKRIPRNRDRDRVDITSVGLPRPEQSRGCPQDSRPSTDVKHVHTRLQKIFQRLNAKASGFMNARAKCHTRIDRDSEAAGGRRIVTPFGNQKKASPYFHRLQEIARGLHPIAIFLNANRGARIPREQRRTVGEIFEEGANGVTFWFRDPAAAFIPKIGDQ